MGIREKTIRGIFWSAAESWGSRVVTFLVFFILAHLLSPKEFGLVALASVFTTFIEIFVDQGFGQAIVQRNHLEPEHLDSAFWSNLGVGACLFSGGVILSDGVALLFGQPEISALIKVLSLSLLINALSTVQEAVLVREMNFKALSIRALVATVISGILGASLAWGGFGAWSLVGQQISNVGIRVIILWIFSNWRPSFRFSKKHFNDLFGFGINLQAIQILTFIDSRSDDFLIGYFLGPTALGYYTVAYRLLLVIVDVLTTFMSRVSMSVFSRLQDAPEKMCESYYKMAEVTALFAFPCFIGIVVSAPEIVSILYGENWSRSILILQILSVGGAFQALDRLGIDLIISKGKANWQLRISSAKSIFSLISFSLAAQWGINAVAAAYCLRNLVLFPFSMALVKKLTGAGITQYLNSIGCPLLSTVIMGSGILLAGRALPPLPDYLILAVNIMLGTAIYSLSITVLNPGLTRRVFLYGANFFNHRQQS